MKTRWIPVLAVLALVPAAVSAERVSLATLQQQIDQLTTTVKGLDEALASTRAELASAREELAKVQANSVLGLDGVLSMQAVAGRDTAVFEGVNVQLTNGAGMTGALNGLGNLVIGYSVDGSGMASRFGSHNIVLGDEQSYPNTAELLTGNIVSSRDLALTVAGDLDTVVGNSQQTTVGVDQTTTVGIGQTINVGANQTIAVGGAQMTTVGSNQTIAIGNDRTEQIMGMSSTSVGADLSLAIGSDLSLNIAKIAMVDAGDELSLKTGAASQLMKKNGDITIQGKRITIKASGDLVLKGSKILQN